MSKREVNLIVCFALKGTIDDDSTEHVQDVAFQEFVEGDTKFALEELVKDGMEITEVDYFSFI